LYKNNYLIKILYYCPSQVTNRPSILPMLIIKNEL
jgi:hypothetical protein